MRTVAVDRVLGQGTCEPAAIPQVYAPHPKGGAAVMHIALEGWDGVYCDTRFHKAQ